MLMCVVLLLCVFGFRFFFLGGEEGVCCSVVVVECLLLLFVCLCRFVLLFMLFACLVALPW